MSKERRVVIGPMFWNGSTITLSYVILGVNGDNYILLLGLGHSVNDPD